ncbi:MAG TPA: hypothetical protein VFR73_06030, partial [Hyphomicrobiaceae bacterium]|nr:hypothetical protein [Hyphomicrobiaceae bacterium]
FVSCCQRSIASAVSSGLELGDLRVSGDPVTTESAHKCVAPSPCMSPGAGRRPLSPFEEALGEQHRHSGRCNRPPLFHV